MGWIDDLEEGNLVKFAHHKKCTCQACKACRAPIRYVTPAGTHGEIPCDLQSLHEGEHDSSQLLLRPADTLKFPI